MTTTTATARPRQRKPRPKPARFIRWVVKPGEFTRTGVVRITVGTEQADYLLTEVPADFGRGFRLEKVGPAGPGDAYCVNLDADKRTCECKGFGRWSHCKHTDGLAALVKAGKL